jgi:hypothetical protein
MLKTILVAGTFFYCSPIMIKPIPSKKIIAFYCLLGVCIGFFIGDGWRIFFDFREWRYETFYRANGRELLLLFWWFWFKPAKTCIIGLILGAALAFFLRRPVPKDEV